MAVEASELSRLLGALLDEGVEFLLVGGGAAVVHGAPITTHDVDIVHLRSPANVRRLLTALRQIEARVIDLGGRHFEPSEHALLGSGQTLTNTRHGRLDILGALHDGRGYEELSPTAERVGFRGRELQVVDLATLIEIKSSTGRAKDRLVVPILIELARRRENRTD